MEIIKAYFDTQHHTIKSNLQKAGLLPDQVDNLVALLSSNMFNTILITGPEPMMMALETGKLGDFINLIDVYYIASEMGIENELVVNAISILWPSMHDYIVNQEGGAISTATALFGDLTEDALLEVKKFTE